MDQRRDYAHPLASYGYGGPFRVSPTRPWDGEPWELDSPLPEGFRYFPIVRWLGGWYAELGALTLGSQQVALVPLDGTEAVPPYRYPVSVVLSEPDEGPYALVYDHFDPERGLPRWYTKQTRVEYYAIQIVPRTALADDETRYASPVEPTLTERIEATLAEHGDPDTGAEPPRSRSI